MSWVSVIEAAYDLDGSAAVWLERIAASLDEILGDGFGTLAISYTIDSSGKLGIEANASVRMSPETQRLVIEINARASAAVISDTYRRHVVATTSSALSPTAYENVIAPARDYGMNDGLGITCADPTPGGVAFIVPKRERQNVSRRIATLGARAASHIKAGARLRASLETDPVDGAEAILDLRGRFQHAEGGARTAEARGMLHRAAMAIDRARSRRRADEMEAVSMWEALVAGRWTIVDRVDTGGRRLFIARKNDPAVEQHHTLTPSERQVVGFAVLGHSNKLIAYEMGVSPSTVAGHLASAAGKLGLRSRATLIQAAIAFCAPRPERS